MSLVTTARDSSPASARHSAATSAVLPRRPGRRCRCAARGRAAVPAGGAISGRPWSCAAHDAKRRHLPVRRARSASSSGIGALTAGSELGSCAATASSAAAAASSAICATSSAASTRGDGERVEPEQPHRGRARAADQVVHGEQRRRPRRRRPGRRGRRARAPAAGAARRARARPARGIGHIPRDRRSSARALRPGRVAQRGRRSPRGQSAPRPSVGQSADRQRGGRAERGRDQPGGAQPAAQEQRQIVARRDTGRRDGRLDPAGVRVAAGWEPRPSASSSSGSASISGGHQNRK